MRVPLQFQNARLRGQTATTGTRSRLINTELELAPPRVQPDSLTFLSYGLIGYLIAPVVVLWLVSLLKETREERPLKEILSFGVAMMTLCAIVILFTTLHRAVLVKANRIETVGSVSV